jgi:hypothetical protein
MTRAIHKRRIVRDDRDFDHIQGPNYPYGTMPFLLGGHGGGLLGGLF